MTELVGCQGVVTVATRGPRELGEVAVSIAGGSETYLAFSEEPIPKGTSVVVWRDLGSRRVLIAPLT